MATCVKCGSKAGFLSLVCRRCVAEEVGAKAHTSSVAVQVASHSTRHPTNDPTENSEPAWYFVERGDRVGPVSAAEMKSLISKGRIGSDTQVWQGEGEWHALRASRLAPFLSSSTASPPPLNPTDVDSKYAWMLLSVPIVGTLIEVGCRFGIPWYAYYATNTLLCGADGWRLAAGGHKRPSGWSVFFVPVYLWKRGTILGRRKATFWIWWILFGCSLAIPEMASRYEIAASATPIVTRILNEQLHDNRSCKRVTVNDSIADDLYRATATLDDGRDLNITIQRRGAEIIVKIPRQ